MSRFLIPVCILMMVLLPACSVKPITKQSVRENPEYQLEFSVQKPYQQVFADILANTKACYLLKPTSSEQLTVDGKRNNANKTANITVEHVYAMAEQEVYLMVDLVSKSESETVVTAYTSDYSARTRVDVVKAWVISNEKACKV